MNYELYKIVYEIDGWVFTAEIYASSREEAIRRADRTILRAKGKKIGKIVSVEACCSDWYMHYSGFNPIATYTESIQGAQENEEQEDQLGNISYDTAYSTAYISSNMNYFTAGTTLGSNGYFYTTISSISGGN